MEAPDVSRYFFAEIFSFFFFFFLILRHFLTRFLFPFLIKRKISHYALISLIHFCFYHFYFFTFPYYCKLQDFSNFVFQLNFVGFPLEITRVFSYFWTRFMRATQTGPKCNFYINFFRFEFIKIANFYFYFSLNLFKTRNKSTRRERHRASVVLTTVNRTQTKNLTFCPAHSAALCFSTWLVGLFFQFVNTKHGRTAKTSKSESHFLISIFDEFLFFE